MSIRHLWLAAMMALCACGEPEQIACCAIEPKAKCESALHGMGLRGAEKSALLGPRPVCPSTSISLERLRELDAQWPSACREARIAPPMIDAGRC